MHARGRAALAALVLSSLNAGSCSESTPAGTPSLHHVAPPAPLCVPGASAADIPLRRFCTERPELPPFAAAQPDGRTLYLRCPESATGLAVSAIDAGVVRLRYGAREPLRAPGSSRAVLPTGAAPPAWSYGTTCAGELVVCSDELVLQVSPGACRLRATDRDGHVLLDDGAAGGGFTAHETIEGRVQPVVGVARATPADERFYGLGQKTGALSRRGRVLVLRNTDAYSDVYGGFAPQADPLYESIPLLLGLRGGRAYGLFTDNTFRQRYDLAATEPGTYRITAAGGEIDQYLIAGPRLLDVLRRYTALTGRAPLPPRWALGYHQSRWGYSAARLREVAGELRRRRIPADGLWLDIQHMRGFRSFTFDPKEFPEPARSMADLAQLGFKVVVIVDPALKVDPGWEIYDAALAGRHLLELMPGVPYVGKVWPGDAVFPDFSAARTRALWAGLVRRVTDAGVRGLWLDMNEPADLRKDGAGTVPDALPADGDGQPTTMAEEHNSYALLEAQASYEGLLAARPGQRPFLLSRAAYAGQQRYTALWTGDAPSRFDTLADTLPMLLGMGLSGFPLVGSDIGGYSGGATPELFARWMALGVLSPFCRAHVTQGVADQEPWAFGQEVEDISRALLQWRYRLLPYLYALARSATETGEPILRPLVLDFQEDAATQVLDEQAMLGPFLLAAPVLQPGARERAVYLPAGRWFEYHSGAVYEGPATIRVGVTLASLPLFVREGAILPHQPLVQYDGESAPRELQLDVYPAAQASELRLYEDDGETLDYQRGGSAQRRLRLQRLPDGAVLEAGPQEGGFVPPSRALLVRVRRIDAATAPGPGPVRLDDNELPRLASLPALQAAERGWFYDEGDLSTWVRLPEPRGAFRLRLFYDPELRAPEPPVRVPLQVRVPAGTPRTPGVHVATSASRWRHVPLSWTTEPDVAAGTVEVPRGTWFEYKYSRGGWDTVEKWAGCTESTNRYGFAAAHPQRSEQVAAWADRCP
ncbi:MAG: glycoside hydrolase family 31 protein [Polyangia bacterium]